MHLSKITRVDVDRSVEGNGLAWMITFRGFDDLSSTMMSPLLVNGVNIKAATDGQVSKNWIFSPLYNKHDCSTPDCKSHNVRHLLTVLFYIN